MSDFDRDDETTFQTATDSPVESQVLFAIEFDWFHRIVY